MRWYRELREILEQEPETWLCYLRGVQFDNIGRLSQAKPRFRGMMLRSLVFVRFVMRNSSFRIAPCTKNTTHPRFLAYANSINQMNALQGTIDALRASGEEVVAITAKRLVKAAKEKDRYIAVEFGIGEVLKGFAFFLVRASHVYKQLLDKNSMAIDWHFDLFCRVYIYLVYFYGLLKSAKPMFVITANDHNVDNRCLLAVAHYLGIETVYMQHASVTELFPALRVNYAFLDGEAALEIYRRCEKNQPSTNREVPVPKVFLTGQKKYLRGAGRRRGSYVGIAVNALDEPRSAIHMVQKLGAAGHEVLLRWHPGAPESLVEQYKAGVSASQNVYFSDPKREHISSFLEKLTVLVAGNSSIHLEAALKGVSPIYCEFGTVGGQEDDGYGYIRNGLVLRVDSMPKLLDTVEKCMAKEELNEEIIRYYSATFKTEWEGREGELVADCLLKLLRGVPDRCLYGAVAF